VPSHRPGVQRPFIELSQLFGAKRVHDRFWERTLENLATLLGVITPEIVVENICVDKRRQWRYVRNLRHSAAVNLAVGTVAAPARWVRWRRAVG
jgi:hypothetical protein